MSRFTYRISFGTLLYLLSACPVAAQPDSSRVNVADPSVFAGSAYPAFFDQTEIGGYDRLEASLSVEDKAAKITWAPFLLSPTYRFWSETRFQLAQKDDITTLGLALRANPLSPRSGRGGRLWESVNSELPNYPDEAGTLAFEIDQDSTKLVQLEDSLRALQEELRKREDTLQRLRESGVDARTAAREDTLSLRMKVETLENEVRALRVDMAIILANLSRARRQLTELDAGYKKKVGAVMLTYRENLASYRGIVPSLSYTISMFPVLAGSSLDDDGDGLNDATYLIKRHALALSADWKLSLSTQLSGVGTFSIERGTAERGSPINHLVGGGVSIGHRLLTLNRSGYRTSKEYKETLFIPGIVIGLASEVEVCVSEETECAKGITREVAITPFIDILVQKSTQFRIGLSGTWQRRVDGETGLTLEPLSLLALQLGLPK